MVMMVTVVMMPGRSERRRREEHHQRQNKKLLHTHHHGTIGISGAWKCDEESSHESRGNYSCCLTKKPSSELKAARSKSRRVCWGEGIGS
jgi:hypothetical protein